MAGKKRNQVDYGAPARVDLLPKRQRAELLHEQTMPKLLLYIVASAVAAGLIWVAGFVPVYFADQRYAEAQADSSAVLAELAEYSDVQAGLSDLSSHKSAREQLTAGEVLFADVRDEVVAGLEEGTTLRGFTGALAGTSGAEGGEIDLGALCTAETATITVRLSNDPESRAEDAVRSLENLTGFSCVVGTKITVSEITVQIALGPDALSHRFSGEAAQ